MTEATRLRSRHMVNNVMLGLTGVFTVFIAGALLFILAYLFINGARNLDWAFFTQLPKPTGEAGGGEGRTRAIRN